MQEYSNNDLGYMAEKRLGIHAISQPSCNKEVGNQKVNEKLNEFCKKKSEYDSMS